MPSIRNSLWLSLSFAPAVSLIGVGASSASASSPRSQVQPGTSLTTFLTETAQEEEDLPGDENEVPPQDVEKYIKVYKAMQQNKTLTVEQATAQQGISVSAFRSLEDKIERNDALREHVRDSLKPSSSPSP